LVFFWFVGFFCFVFVFVEEFFCIFYSDTESIARKDV